MSVLQMNFVRGEDSIRRINDALAGMCLSDVRIRDSRGCLATRKDFDENGQVKAVAYSYLFDSIALETTGDETMGTRTWRIETAVFLKGSPNAPQNSDAFFDSWSAGHPDRSVRVIQWITFDKADVFIVLSRGR